MKTRISWAEFCDEQEREEERERKALESYRQQMREQRPGLFLSWKQLLKAFIVLAGLVALPWIVVYAVAAWFRLW